MRNIQAQYQDLLEGRMSKTNFMRNVRMQFPQHIAPTTSFDDSVKILKGKRILSEAKKPEGVYGHNPNAEMDEYRRIDHLNYYQVYHGIQYELAKMSEITDENYIKARKKVVDTILKDPDAYKNLQLANFKAVKEMDEDLEMKEVKKNNHTDKPNEMKVVKKDVKGNTQDNLGKKEAKKSKNGKGVEHMTQTPKGKLEAFPTPGKEKIMALKEHILDELMTSNPHHEEFHKGMEVYKKKGNSGPGEIIEYDGHTATVKWKNGTTEDLQKNVLTKQQPVEQVEEASTETTGLLVKGRTKEDNTDIQQMIDEMGLHAEWYADSGRWFFPEEEENYDALEKIIQDELDDREIDATIEGVFSEGSQEHQSMTEEFMSEKESILHKIKERLVKALKTEKIKKNPQTGTAVSTKTAADDALAAKMGYTQTIPSTIEPLGKM